MPFDANGNFSLVPGTIVADGMNVLPSQHNPPFQDVANGLSQAVVRDGRAPMTGPLNMNGNKITGVAAGDAPDDVVTNAAIADLGVAIGDGKWSLRDLSPNWLRRDGALYDIADYPELAALLPALPDGIDWTQRTSGITDNILDVIHDGTRYIAVGGRFVASSVNGEEWVVIAEVAGANFTGIVYGLGIYVASCAEGRVYTSTNAEEWNSQSIINGSGLLGVCFHADSGLFVVCGGGGYIATSDNGSAWTSRTSGTSSQLRRIRSLGANIVSVGASGTIISSSNATSWTTRTSGVTELLYDVAYDGTIYFVVGSAGLIRTSPNLVTWTGRTSGTSATLFTALASSAGLVAAGSSGDVRLSTNGTSWAASATGVSSSWRGGVVAHDNAGRYFLTAGSNVIFDGLRTLPTQFRVPNDDPTYGWVRAL